MKFVKWTVAHIEVVIISILVVGGVVWYFANRGHLTNLW